MGGCQAGPHHEFYNKVAVAYTPQTVFSKRLETEFLCKEVTVDSERVTSKCAGAQREDGYPRDELAKALEIGVERESMGQEEVGPTNGLPALYIDIVN